MRTVVGPEVWAALEAEATAELRLAFVLVKPFPLLEFTVESKGWGDRPQVWPEAPYALRENMMWSKP